MESLYFPNATVFNSNDTHSETARLTLARRLRQFAEEKLSRSAELGTIDVRVMDDVAIASYPYHFRQSSVNKDGYKVDLNVPFSSATQVFWRDKSGNLRIAHEHFSAAEPGKKTQGERLGASIPEALMPRPSAFSSANRASAGSLPPSDNIFAEQVRAEVRKLWQMYRSKSKESLEQMYTPTALAWVLGGKRATPIRLVLATKSREILGPQSSVTAELTTVDVQTLSKSVAVASYSFRYCFVRVQGYGKRADTDEHFQGRRYSFDCPQARGTHVLERDEKSVLQVVHEHISTAGIPIYKELPATSRETAATR
jgi:ketosteroid isomerase-like protein